MHWIERHILKVLAFNDTKRYSELKPDSVDGNLFQYHAKQLEKLGLIERNPSGYRLTSAGKVFVADLSQTKLMNARKTPRSVVMIVAKKNHKYLLFKWKRQPYRGQISLPFGRQLYGRSSLDCAEEQLLLKTGYSAELRFIGMVDSINQQDDKIVDHILINVFEAKKLNSIHNPDGLTGESIWEDPAKLSKQEVVYGLDKIIQWYEDKNRSSLLNI
jgi:ADP-ribose pyrophosphatase YjhB (NUDIX family)